MEQLKTSPLKQFQEVEKRALLSPQQRENIFEKLIQMGAKLQYVAQLQDTYFCSKSVKSFSEIAMDKVGSFSLRLRRSIKDNEEARDLNIKVITMESDHHAWEEHEVKIDSSEEMQAIIFALGYKIFIIIDKVRHLFSWRHLSIAIEDIDNFGSAIEIEILTTKEKVLYAKEEIEKFLAEMGISNEEIVPKSITYIIMQNKSLF